MPVIPEYRPQNKKTSPLTIARQPQIQAGTSGLQTLSAAANAVAAVVQQETDRNHAVLARQGLARIHTAQQEAEISMRLATDQEKLDDKFQENVISSFQARRQEIIGSYESAHVRNLIQDSLDASDTEGRLRVTALGYQKMARHNIDNLAFKTDTQLQEDYFAGAARTGDAVGTAASLNRNAQLYFDQAKKAGLDDEKAKDIARIANDSIIRKTIEVLIKDSPPAQLEQFASAVRPFASEGLNAFIERKIRDSHSEAFYHSRGGEYITSGGNASLATGQGRITANGQGTAPIQSNAAASQQTSMNIDGKNITVPLKAVTLFNQFVVPIESNGRQFDKNGNPLRPIDPQTGKAESSAVGVGQLTIDAATDAARSLGIELDLNRLATDEAYNRLLSAQYLNLLLDQFDGSAPLAVFAYNAGPGTARRMRRELAASGINPDNPDYWRILQRHAAGSNVRFAKGGADYLSKIAARNQSLPLSLQDISVNPSDILTAQANAIETVSPATATALRAAASSGTAAVPASPATPQATSPSAAVQATSAVPVLSMTEPQLTRYIAEKEGIGHMFTNGAPNENADPVSIKMILNMVKGAVEKQKEIKAQIDIADGVLANMSVRGPLEASDVDTFAPDLPPVAKQLMRKRLDPNTQTKLEAMFRAGRYRELVKDDTSAKALLNHHNTVLALNGEGIIPLSELNRIRMIANGYDVTGAEKNAAATRQLAENARMGILSSNIKETIKIHAARIDGIPKEGTDDRNKFDRILWNYIHNMVTSTGKEPTPAEIVEVLDFLATESEHVHGFVFNGTAPNWEIMYDGLEKDTGDTERDNYNLIVPYGTNRSAIETCFSEISGGLPLDDTLRNYFYTKQLVLMGASMPQDVLQTLQAIDNGELTIPGINDALEQWDKYQEQLTPAGQIVTKSRTQSPASRWDSGFSQIFSY